MNVSPCLGSITSRFVRPYRRSLSGSQNFWRRIKFCVRRLRTESEIVQQRRNWCGRLRRMFQVFPCTTYTKYNIYECVTSQKSFSFLVLSWCSGAYSGCTYQCSMFDKFCIDISGFLCPGCARVGWALSRANSNSRALFH